MKPIENSYIKSIALSRRSFIASSVFLMMQRNKSVFAQSVNFESTAKEVITNARNVLEFAIAAPIKNINSSVIEFVVLDYQSRQQVFNNLREFGTIPNATDIVARLPVRLENYANVDFSEESQNFLNNVVIDLQTESISLIPSLNSIEPIGIPSILKVPDDQRSNDTDLKVIGDIIIEIFGIGEPGLLTQLIESNAELEKKFSDLAAHISTKDWHLVAEGIENLLNSSIVLDVLSGLQGRAKRQLLTRLALRAVPFVGWAYALASIIMTIKSNYHRFSFA